MNNYNKYYKFINSETDNVIFFLSLPETEPDPKTLLENIRHKLAYEKATYIGNIYYTLSQESDFNE